MKHTKVFYDKKYQRYKQELQLLRKRTGKKAYSIGKKAFVTAYERAAQSLKNGAFNSKVSISRVIAQTQVYNVDYITARRVKTIYKEATGQSMTIPEIRTKTTSIIADELKASGTDLNEVYKKLKADAISKGKSQHDAVEEAKEYVSWYYFGSN